MQFLLKSTFYRLLYMAFSFVTGLLISGWAGTELFGTISIFVVNASLLALVSGMGHDASLYWHKSSGKISSSQALGYGWVIIIQQLGVFIVLSLLSLYFSGHLLLSRMGVEFLWKEFGYFAGIILVERYITFFYSSGKAVFCNRLLSVMSMLTLLLPALCFHYFPQRLPEPFTIFCMIPFLHGLALLLFFHIGHLSSGIALPARSGLSSIFGFSFLVFVTNLLQFLAYRVDYWLIGYFSGDEGQVGLYAQASRFAQLFWVIPNIVAAIIYHDLSAEGSSFGKKELAGLLRGLNGFNLLTIPFLVLFTSGSIFLFLTDFSASFYVFLILLGGMFFFCNSILLASFFSAKRNLWMNFLVSSVCLSVIIIFDLLLIPAYGIRGAAWANTLAYGAAGLLSVIIFSRKEGLYLAELLVPRKSDLKTIRNLFFRNAQ